MNPPYWHAFILFSASAIGGVFFFLTRKHATREIKLVLSFSAAYLLGITLLHLFPELFASEIEHAGWWVLGGFLLQVILDFFSHGVEHGHAHTHHHEVGTRFLIPVMISLWIHAFIEGMPFGGTALVHAHEHGGHVHAGHDHRGSLLLGISFHKITESVVFAALLFQSTMKRSTAFLWLLLFALMAPLGAFTHYWAGETGMVNVGEFTVKVTGILIGILLHVSTIILFESDHSHKFNWMKFGSILLGIALAAMVSTM
jgi:zinc transporter ZupT